MNFLVSLKAALGTTLLLLDGWYDTRCIWRSEWECRVCVTDYSVSVSYTKDGTGVY